MKKVAVVAVVLGACTGGQASVEITSPAERTPIDLNSPLVFGLHASGIGATTAVRVAFDDVTDDGELAKVSAIPTFCEPCTFTATIDPAGLTPTSHYVLVVLYPDEGNYDYNQSIAGATTELTFVTP